MQTQPVFASTLMYKHTQVLPLKLNKRPTMVYFYTQVQTWPEFAYRFKSKHNLSLPLDSKSVTRFGSKLKYMHKQILLLEAQPGFAIRL